MGQHVNEFISEQQEDLDNMALDNSDYQELTHILGSSARVSLRLEAAQAVIMDLGFPNALDEDLLGHVYRLLLDEESRDNLFEDKDDEDDFLGDE